MKSTVPPPVCSLTAAFQESLSKTLVLTDMAVKCKMLLLEKKTYRPSRIVSYDAYYKNPIRLSFYIPFPQLSKTSTSFLFLLSSSLSLSAPRTPQEAHHATAVAHQFIQPGTLAVLHVLPLGQGGGKALIVVNVAAVVVLAIRRSCGRCHRCGPVQPQEDGHPGLDQLVVAAGTQTAGEGACKEAELALLGRERPQLEVGLGRRQLLEVVDKGRDWWEYG